MELTLAGVLTDLLVSRLPTTKLGIVVRGLPDIAPVHIAADVASAGGVPLAVAVIDYPAEPVPGIELATTVEAAVAWRNQASRYAGRILVFVPGEIEKLGSLATLDHLTTRDVTLHVIRWAERALAATPPQQRFWATLGTQAATLPFRMLLDFAAAIAAAPHELGSIPRALWRLGLLEDGAVLNASADVALRLDRNRALMTAIGQLSDTSRKRMNQVLRRTSGQDQQRLREAARQLREFFERGDHRVLEGLRFDDVERLIQASATPGPGPNPPTHPLQGNALAQAVASHVVRGADPAVVKAYLSLVQQRMQDDQAEIDPPIDHDVLKPISGGQMISITVSRDILALRAFIGTCCTSESWGGIIHTNQDSLREVIQKMPASTRINRFTPNLSIHGDKSLVDLLEAIDVNITGVPSLVTTWHSIEAARAELTPFLDMLIVEPLVFLYANLQARSIVQRYLDQYATLLQTLQRHASVLEARYARSYRLVLRWLLHLDVIIVVTAGDAPNAYGRHNAILTPLHPLHLWRFRSILERTGSDLSDVERDLLISALGNLPHLLHVVVCFDERGDAIALPQVGSIETLPIFEHRADRFLGNDGIEVLDDVLKSWLAFAPYSQPQIRLALIDVPNLSDALRRVWQFLRSRSQVRIIIDAYRTRAHHALEQLADMEFETHDSDIADALINGVLRLNIIEHTSLRDVVATMEHRPVHIVYSFDQSSYTLAKATRTPYHVVSPIITTYRYTYDEGLHRGEIAPSSDTDHGIFADYHHLISHAINLREDQTFQIQIGRGGDVDALNGILSSQRARWLVVADRTLLGYAPHDAVPLAEQLHGQREVAIWAYITSRSVKQFIETIRMFNVRPNESHTVQIMQRFGHIAAEGLFSAVRGSNRSHVQQNAQRKGLIGAILAAHWYIQQHPGALIASLDSSLARQWLTHNTESHERADLIGLREDDAGELTIDVIEVKAVEHAGSEVHIATHRPSGRVSLSGPAVEQVRATIAALQPMFAAGALPTDLFSQARREALRYQLYRECFREFHAPADQHRWYLRLNRAFDKTIQGTDAVACRGIIVHLHFEDHGDTDIIVDASAPVTLVRLRDAAIQRLVGQREPSVTPPAPMPEMAADHSPAVADTRMVSIASQEHTSPSPAIDDDSLPTKNTLLTSIASHEDPFHPFPATDDDKVVLPLQKPDNTTISAIEPNYDVLLGDTQLSRQYGIIGRQGNKTVALDLNSTNTISLFGVQGGGKSYTLGSIVEMATRAFRGINHLPSPLASVIFHYHASQDYPPEFVSMVAPNSKKDELRSLMIEYGAQPERLDDVVILTSADHVARRQLEFPSVHVSPILFNSRELSLRDWRFLMGAFGQQMYMKQINLIMRQLRQDITLDALRSGLEASDLSDHQKNIAQTRFQFASQFIDDNYTLSTVLQPGRLVIVDLRDEFIDKDEALGLFVVLLTIFANAGQETKYNKLMVFDEAHKYLNNAELTGHIVDVIRQMRHQGVSLLIASQDPLSLASAIIELSSVVILHRFNAPKWLKHIQQSVAALNDLTPTQLASLRPGEGFIWAARSTDAQWMNRAVKLRFRPRLTQHGGATKTAT